MKQQKDQRHLAINVDLEKLLKFLERTDVLRRQEWGGVTLTKIPSDLRVLRASVNPLSLVVSIIVESDALPASARFIGTEIFVDVDFPDGGPVAKV